MKMGTIVSSWRYDAAARHALKLAGLRCSAIEHHASWIHSIEEWAGYRSKTAIPGSLPDRRGANTRPGAIHFRFSGVFATSRAQSMKSCATGLSVRVFRVMIPFGTRALGR